jgi:hypothetical protein
MKPREEKRRLLFGDFIAAAYDAWGKREAPGIVSVAVNARWVEFLGDLRLLIAPKRSRYIARVDKYVSENSLAME